MEVKKKIALLSTAAFVAAGGAWGLTKTSKEASELPLPIKFRHERSLSEGLYAVKSPKKVCKVPTIKSTAGRPELVANCISRKPGYGMYSFFAESGLTLNKIADLPAFNGGAVYVNGKYYAADYDYDSTNQLEYVEWYVYDATTWRREKVVSNPLDWTYVATDRTYDPTTGTVYSVTYDKTGTALNLSTTSLSDGSSTEVGPLSKYVLNIAASPAGELYGIDYNANLYRIDKRTAALTLIGNTNIYDDYEAPYIQSITFDPESGKILWAEFHSEGMFSSSAALFQVDPATAKTVKIADIPGGPELIGLYVTDYYQAGVPAIINDLNAVPTAVGSLDYNFTLTAPSVTTDGSVLQGSVTMEISVDGDLLDIQEAAPGEKITSGPFTLTRGMHAVKVTAENETGVGPVAAYEFFAGYDVPAAPQNVKFTFADGQGQVSWAAPSQGAEGGAIRTPLTYNVIRMPGEVKVAEGISSTSFSEPLTEAARYYYKITAVSPEGEGVTAESNNLVAGSCKIPFITSFDSQKDFDLWTIVDVTSNGKVWNYDEDNHRLRHPWSLDGNIDDYIFSPALEMDGSKTYSVSFDAYQMVASYNEHVMLYFGPSPNPEDMTFVLDTKVLGESPANFSATVAPSKSGLWYIAFRSTAGKNGFMSYVDNVRVLEKGSSEVAAGVENFTAQAAAGGALEVTLSFDAPSKTMQGSALESISHIDILRGEGSEPIKTFDAPAPGSHISWTDATVKKGVNTYRAVVYTQAGAGEPVSVKAFAGIDVPEAPVNFKAEGKEGERLLSWQAPAQGKNGGNLEGVLKYKLIRVVNDNEEVIDNAISDTSYTDTWSSEEQAFVYYALQAVTSAGESESVTSDSFAVGNPYELPYTESFAGGKPQTNPWSVEQVAGAQGSWLILKNGENPYIKAQDDDEGVATFDGFHSYTTGCELRLISPTINLRTYKDTKLSFYIYHYNGTAGWWQSDPDPVEETMMVEISQDGKPFEALPKANYTLYNSKSGWTKYEIPLDNYKKNGGVRIAFRGKGAGCFNIHLDNIRVDGTYDVSAVDAPSFDASKVAGGKGAILFRNLDSKATVYDLQGRKIAEVNPGTEVIRVSSGVFVVVCNESTHKINVR